jgi:homoserine dehydrogenase
VTAQTAPVGVGLLGCGTVGGALVELIASEREAVAARTGLDLVVRRVGVRSLDRARPTVVDADLLTTDLAAIVVDPEVDVVVEAIGGIEPARQLVVAALEAGKPVVTANKALIAAHGAELFATAEAAGVDLQFEAAVGGAIPLIRVLREQLLGERIRRVMGIVNGTTNYILTRMTEEGADYAATLADAQRLGYAEAEPSADVDGHDAAAKAAILATVAYGADVDADRVYREGIGRITADDIDAARRMGRTVKLLAVVERIGEELAVRVHPVMLPTTHPLAAVRESFNAVFVEGEAVDDLMFYGRGAGGRPTASAMLGDLIVAASDLRRGSRRGLGALVRTPLVGMERLRSASTCSST